MAKRYTKLNLGDPQFLYENDFSAIEYDTNRDPIAGTDKKLRIIANKGTQADPTKSPLSGDNIKKLDDGLDDVAATTFRNNIDFSAYIPANTYFSFAELKNIIISEVGVNGAGTLKTNNKFDPSYANGILTIELLDGKEKWTFIETTTNRRSIKTTDTSFNYNQILNSTTMPFDNLTMDFLIDIDYSAFTPTGAGGLMTVGNLITLLGNNNANGGVYEVFGSKWSSTLTKPSQITVIKTANANVLIYDNNEIINPDTNAIIEASLFYSSSVVNILPNTGVGSQAYTPGETIPQLVGRNLFNEGYRYCEIDIAGVKAQGTVTPRGELITTYGYQKEDTKFYYASATIELGGVIKSVGYVTLIANAAVGVSQNADSQIREINVWK